MVPSPAEALEPDVFLDVVFEDGLLFIEVGNATLRPAEVVEIKFGQSFHGLGGGTDFAKLRLFRRIEYLAPGRRIRALLDSSAAYFARKEPTKLTATVKFRDHEGKRHQREITHDLAIYRDLPYVVQPCATAASSGDPTP
jgi:hypothetical protein